jgi:hypothetical protein
MDGIQKLALEYNAVRNANFFMWAALLTDLAKVKGSGGEEWLKGLRAAALGELDAAKMRNLADELTPETAQSAEIARSVIGAVFSMAEDRHKKRR